MMSGNQIQGKSASNIGSHIIFFSSSTKKSYLLLLNLVLGVSVAMNKRFSKFICDNWFRSWILTSFSFEKNLSTHAVLRGKIDIKWSSFKQLGKIIAQALSYKHVKDNLCASKEVSEAWKVSLSFSFLQFISFIWNFSSLTSCFSNIYFQNPGHSSIAATPSISPTWFIVMDLYVLAFSLP